MRTPSRLPGLDTLRAIAVSLVFMYHYWLFVSRETTFGWASEVGWVGVDLFFVLSGYLIANQLLGGLVRGQRLSLGAFYARRALRTWPLFWVMLAAYWLAPAWMGGRTPPPLWRFLSFTQNIQLQPGTAFSHAWSLCIEEQFYLVLPLVALGVAALAHRFTGEGRASRPVWPLWALLAGLMAAAVAWRWSLWLPYGREAGGQIERYYPNVYYATLCRADEFLPGVAMALLKHLHPALWQRLMARGGALFAAGLAATGLMLYAALRHYYIEGYGYGFAMTAFGYSGVALAFSLLVASALSPQSPLHRVRVPGAQGLALVSYSLYLSHKPVAHIVATLGGETLAASPALRLVAVTLACGAVAALLYHLVERPFMALRDRHVPEQFQPAAPAAGALRA